MSDVEPARFEPATPPLSQGLAVGSALVAALALLPSPPAAALALGAVAGVLVGTRLLVRRLLDAAVLAATAGLLLAGIDGVAPPLLVVATAATLVAYDAAETGLSVGKQIGRRGRSRRLVVVRFAVAAAAAAGVSAAVYAAFLLAGRAPATAVTLLLIGGLLVAAALRR
ncbi:hypothetical protein [Halosegnis sp.]|uniref:DUF7519 family protein n=1 Tax=Halosegnis sp. TaxID=2864959 RepID=UPI0035D43EE6